MSEQPTTQPPKATAERSDADLNVRLPSSMRQRVAEIAAAHGRSMSETVKWAIVLFDCQVVLAELLRPETRAAMGADATAAAIAEVQADLRKVSVAALNPPLAARAEMN